MSSSADEKIAYLEQQLNIAQQCMYGILRTIGEPVVVNMDDLKAWLETDSAVAMDLDEDTNSMVFTAGAMPSVSS